MPAQSNCSSSSDEAGDREIGETAWVIVNNDAEPDGETGTAWYRLYGPQLPERAGGARLDRLFQLARAVGTKVRWQGYRDRFLARQ